MMTMIMIIIINNNIVVNIYIPMSRLDTENMKERLALVRKIESTMRNPERNTGRRENVNPHRHTNEIASGNTANHDMDHAFTADHSHTDNSTLDNVDANDPDQKLFDQLKEIGSTLTTQGVGTAKKIIERSGEAVDAIVDQTGNIITKTITGVGETTESAITEVQGVLGTTIDSVGTTASTLAGAVGNTGSHIIQSIESPVEEALDQVDNVATSLFSTVGGTATKLSDEILIQADTLINETGQLTDSLVTNTENVGSTLLDNTGEVANNFTGNTKLIFNKSFDAVQKAHETSINETQSMFQTWMPWVMGVALLLALCYGAYKFSIYLASSGDYEKGYGRLRRIRRRNFRPYIDDY